MSKYRAVRVGGHASKREGCRASELLILERIGDIAELEQQVKYELIPKQDGERSVTYTADFRYRPVALGVVKPEYVGKDGRVVEDSKGFKTQQYILRRKLMLWVHGIRILET